VAAKITVHLLKAVLTPTLWLLRVLVFNRELPPVGRRIANLRYGPLREHRLDAYVPQGDGPFPVLVFVHGGGFIAGSKEMYERIGRDFAARGYLAFCITYRLAPRHQYPAGVQDVAAAVRWIHDRAAEYGGTPATIFLAGDSAGANLAAWYALMLGRPDLLAELEIERAVPRECLRGLLLFYGVYDVGRAARSRFPFARTLTRCLLGNDPAVAARRAWVASPIRYVDPGAPPMFLCVGQRDPLYSQSVRLAARLRARGVPHRTLFFPRGQYPTAWHGFLNFYRSKPARTAMAEAVKFLDELARPRRGGTP
jgi:acetyl esterase/lipase